MPVSGFCEAAELTQQLLTDVFVEHLLSTPTQTEETALVLTVEGPPCSDIWASSEAHKPCVTIRNETDRPL